MEGRPRRRSALSSRSLRGLAAGVTVLAALAGCGGGDNGSPSSSGRTTLTVWDGVGLSGDSNGVVVKSKSFLYQAVDRFQKANPNITVKIVQQPSDLTQASNQFRAASIARNGPDVRTGYAGGPTLSFAQFLEPLDTHFTAQEQAKLKGWDTVRAGYSPQGKILALPYGAGSYFYVYYRKSLLRKAGEDMSSPPKTWEDMVALAERLKAKGHTPFYLANQEGYVGAWVVAALAGGQGGHSIFLDQYLGKQKVDSPAMTQAYEAYKGLYAKGLTNKDAGEVANGQAAQGFTQGKGDMFINGGWNNASLYDTLKDDVGFFPIPTLRSATTPGVLAGGPNNAISVTSYSKHKPEAIKFLKFLAQPQILDLFVKLQQSDASNHVDSDASIIKNPLLKAQAQQLKTAPTVYPFDNVMPQDVIDLFYRLNAGVFLGSTSVSDATRQLQAAFDKAKK
jgi:ABC-type glycerol-3-phosphate transport system substrate-binding protein